MAKRFYMSLVGIGDWDKAMKVSGAQLAPYRTYLKIAKKAANSRALSLAWRVPSLDERKVLDQRLLDEMAEATHRSKNAQRRRDRFEVHAMPSGVWVMLDPRPGRVEEPEKTFDAFLKAKDVYERALTSAGKAAEIKILNVDRERCALLLARLPTEIPPAGDDQYETESSRAPELLLFLRPNTWPLECQIRSLKAMEDCPSPRIAPLLRLVSTRPEWPQVEPLHVKEGDWLFLRSNRDGSKRDGTEEQRNFVQRALATPDFSLLEGPPGSGKTTAICELIVQLIREGKRVLLVASTHVAVDNVLERLMEWQDDSDEKLVMPIRIGDDDNITADEIKPWILRNLLKSWHGDILDYLDKPKNGTADGEAARKLLKGAITSKDENSDFAHMLLDASNLVCGTTIGILQHPAIKAASKDGGGFEPFDFMILDEASKTTFTEFLVPAAYAKRWVVVGDTRQLSPFVDEKDLAENISGLLPPEISRATVHTFMASASTPQARRIRSLIAVESDAEASMIAEEANEREVIAVDLGRLVPSALYGQEGACKELLYADIVYGNSEAISAWEHRLPGDLQVVVGNVPELSDWNAHRSALKVKTDEEPVTWADEVAWRQIRTYELRGNPAEEKRYRNELFDLIPNNLEDDCLAYRKRDLRKLRDGSTQTPYRALEEDLENMRRVSMPSILEILQSGAGSLADWEQETALTEGLPEAVLEERMVSLSFQHRMHPDISSFPRDQFYSDDGLLQDASGMSDSRMWGYKRYAKRATWLDITPRKLSSKGNANPAEIDAAMEELKEFSKWAATAPRPGKNQQAPWEVAVLTFYRGQEAGFRKSLQKFCRQPGNTRNFVVPDTKGRVHVTLCTVDSFQGHEADLVLLSFVKSGTPGFLNSPNRLNVALTRARYQIVLIGHRSWMASKRCSSELLRALGDSEHYPINFGWNKHD